MQNIQKSNITIAPNIYVRVAQNLQADDNFIKSVYGHKALNLLRARFPKSYSARLTRAQIEEMKQNVVCRLGKSHEHAYGKATSDGKTVWSCRCENAGCHAYERCMAFPNALRINRGVTVSQDEGIGESTQYGFDYEKCSFEPPAYSETSATELIEMIEGTLTPEQDYRVYLYTAENPRFEPNTKTLVVCADELEAGYFSTILHKEGIKHHLLCSEGYTLNRRIADIFWDYCGERIEKDAFVDRYIVRVGGSEEQAREFYRALYEICGESNADYLAVSSLADALSGSGAVSEHMLNMDGADCAVAITVPEKIVEGYDSVLLLECDKRVDGVVAVIKKENPSEWIFKKSTLGRACRISLDNYKGEQEHCLNIEFGLWGDVDGKSFIAEETGDSILLQLYISEKVKKGDELSVEKNPLNGGYSFYHKGNALGGLPESLIREITDIDGFPDDFAGFEGVYVKNIVTCVGDKDDRSLPSRFRDSRIWLGLELTGYAKIKI